MLSMHVLMCMRIFYILVCVCGYVCLYLCVCMCICYCTRLYMCVCVCVNVCVLCVDINETAIQFLSFREKRCLHYRRNYYYYYYYYYYVKFKSRDMPCEISRPIKWSTKYLTSQVDEVEEAAENRWVVLRPVKVLHLILSRNSNWVEFKKFCLSGFLKLLFLFRGKFFFLYSGTESQTTVKCNEQLQVLKSLRKTFLEVLE